MKPFSLHLILLICCCQSMAQETLIPFRVKDKWGYSDTSGKIRIKPRFQYVGFFSPVDDYAKIYDNAGTGLINRKGKIAVPCIYRNAETSGWLGYDFNKPSVPTGAIVTTHSNKSGIHSMSSGKLLVDTLFENIYYFHNGLFHVKAASMKEGIFDTKSGKWMAEPVYDYASLSSDNDVIATLDQKEFLIPILPNGPGTPREQTPKPIILEEVTMLPAGSAATPIQSQPPVAEKKEPSSEELYTARLYKENGLYGFRFDYHFKGDTLPPIHDSIDRAGEYAGVLAVKKDGRWGLINSKGKLLLPIRYEGVDAQNSILEKQLYVVKQENRKAIIDPDGKIITTGYDDIQNADNRFFILRQGDLFGILFLPRSHPPVLIQPQFYKVNKEMESIPVGNEKYIYLAGVQSSQHHNSNGFISETGKKYFID